MPFQGVVSRTPTREQVSADLRSARVLTSVELYHSETLMIERVATDRAGVYYVVTESDVVFPEDIDALEALGREVGEPWRTRVLETDVYGVPHPDLPMSSTFHSHIVHPSYSGGRPRRAVFV